MSNDGSDGRERLAVELAQDAVAAASNLFTPQEQQILRLALETDLLFDPRYRDLMKLAILDEAPRAASEAIDTVSPAGRPDARDRQAR